MTKAPLATFRLQDVAEIAVGAGAMAFPVVVTEEVWNLGAELSTARILYIASGSLLVLAFFIHMIHHRGREVANRREFVTRVLSTYGLTLTVSALLLLGVDRLELLENPAVALRRTVLVAFPASFAATVVDSIGDSGRR